MKVICVLWVILICVTSNSFGFSKVRKIQSRIISGEPAVVDQIPWQVLIKKSQQEGVYCGGSIIDKDWVLTAAHCVAGLKSIYMVFGTINVKDETTHMTSDQFFIHTKFDPKFLNNDVALIKLPNSLQLSKNIAPIRLVKKEDANKDFVGEKAMVSGWGYYSDEDLEYSEELLYAFMKVVENSVCREIFGEGYIIDSTLCAQGSEKGNESICGGDSGGAMVIADSDNQFTQIAINSFVADQVCSEGYPAGFARLGSFLDFIESTTGIPLL